MKWESEANREINFLFSRQHDPELRLFFFSCVMLDLDGGRACWIVGILLEQCDMWLWCLKKCLTEESDLCWWVLFIEVLKRSKKSAHTGCVATK
jgi:hypothetical protein